MHIKSDEHYLQTLRQENLHSAIDSIIDELNEKNKPDEIFANSPTKVLRIKRKLPVGKDEEPTLTTAGVSTQSQCDATLPTAGTTNVN